MNKRLPLTVLAIVLLAAVARADTLTPYGGVSTWSSWSPAILSPGSYTGAFWNTSSNDAGECNIGYWITGTLGCNVTSINGYDYQFYSQSPGLHTPTPDFFGNGSSTFGFTPSGETVEVTLGVQMAKWARPTDTQYGGIIGSNVFGWYQEGGGGGVLFGPGSTLGQVATFNPTGAYGFYIQSPIGYFTSGLLDGNGLSHFAAFAVDPATGHYIIGAEDNVLGSGGDFDFNDLVVTVKTAQVPEPGTLLLLGTGLIGLGSVVRRQKRNR